MHMLDRFDLDRPRACSDWARSGRARARTARGARSAPYLVKVVLVELAHKAAKVVVLEQRRKDDARERVRVVDHKAVAALAPRQHVLDARVLEDSVIGRDAARARVCTNDAQSINRVLARVTARLAANALEELADKLRHAGLCCLPRHMHGILVVVRVVLVVADAAQRARRCKSSFAVRRCGRLLLLTGRLRASPAAIAARGLRRTAPPFSPSVHA